MKIGVNLNIDVTKLDKSKFFKGKKGTYADLTVFIDPNNPGQYGDHGIITQSADKGVDMPILGNAKVFWREDGQQQPKQQTQQAPQQQAPSMDDDFEDSIPF